MLEGNGSSANIKKTKAIMKILEKFKEINDNESDKFVARVPTFIDKNSNEVF